MGDKSLLMVNIKQSPRNLAVTVLERVINKQAYSNLELNQIIQQAKLSVADKHLLTNLVYGTLQHRLTLENWLKPFVKREPVPWVRELLLITLYQYHYLKRVPDFAATNEAIEITKFRGHGNQGLRKFVTGVLHAVLRSDWPDLTTIEDPIEQLSLTASLPLWLTKKLVDENGLLEAQKIGKAINDPARLSIRANRQKGTVGQITDQLAMEGITTIPSQVAADGLIVTKGDLLGSQAFRSGLVTVQDESAMLAVEAMAAAIDLKTANLVLDACSAPGGKTGQLAAQVENGKVIALDIHQHKVKLIKKNMARLGLSDRVVAKQNDARDLTFLADQTLDAALVDAPCSGMGLLRRKPEIRYQKQFSDSQQLHKIQTTILDAVAPKIKKGGIIIYSTCTILHEENDETVVAFLTTHPNFALEKTQTARALKTDRATKTLTILPSDYGSDGFFIATLRRKN